MAIPHDSSCNDNDKRDESGIMRFMHLVQQLKVNPS